MWNVLSMMLLYRNDASALAFGTRLMVDLFLTLAEGAGRVVVEFGFVFFTKMTRSRVRENSRWKVEFTVHNPR